MDGPTLVVTIIVGWLLVALLYRAIKQARSDTPLGGHEQALRYRTVPTSFKLFEFRNVIVPDERGTTEIDVILVGNTGVFVVEKKEYNAWIFGNENDERWIARYIDGSTHRLQNPLRQNYRHVMALASRLGLARDKFHSLVAFSGDCELKTPVPSNVFVGDYYKHAESIAGIRLIDADVSRVCEVLDALEAQSSEIARADHVNRLRERFSSKTTCPKCGSPLVQRRSSKATSDGQPFMGCRAYPKCTYTRNYDLI